MNVGCISQICHAATLLLPIACLIFDLILICTNEAKRAKKNQKNSKNHKSVKSVSFSPFFWTKIYLKPSTKEEPAQFLKILSIQNILSEANLHRKTHRKRVHEKLKLAQM
jgi:hypothetical protein